ncbi:pupal cuticle protein Edg-78E-like isoform 1-T2 [Cochliomyia hominivorax]
MNKIIFVAVLATLACGAWAASDADRYAEITKYENYIDQKGNYKYEYATTNGINAGEQGVGGETASGGFSYQSPEGEFIQISYLADENGFQPQGAHLPTPPPIPAHILKALEYIRTHPPQEN